MLDIPKDLYPFEVKKHKLSSGHEMAYIDEGEQDEDKPCLLMVHGNPTWSFYYRNCVRDFSDKFRCIAVDHIGCGSSDKPQKYSYTLSQHIENLRELVAHCGLKKIILVLHDWGGAIGMGLATQEESKIKGIVILNTAAFFSNRIPLRIQICRLPFIGTWINRGLNGFALAATTMATARGKSLPVDVAKTLVGPYDSWHNRVAIDQFVKDIPVMDKDRAFKTIQEIEENLIRFKDVPKIIFWGAQDFCFNDSFYKKWLEFFPDAENYYYKDGGHYILEDCYSDIKKKLEVFTSNF
jgi:cis-3-alkyl-4-acyloxetan-2-one decarboxylase